MCSTSSFSGIASFGVALVLSATLADAQDTHPTGFKTPSGNIHCMLDDFELSEGRPVSLRCDVMQTEGKLPEAPSWCDLEWGRAFSIGQLSDRAEMVCAGDSVYSDGWLVLEYGGTWERYGITCVSDKTGLTCTNPRGHGFLLSRAKQKLF